MDEILTTRISHVPWCIRNVVASLAISSENFQIKLKRVSNDPIDTNSWSIEVHEGSNEVKTTASGGEQFKYGLNFKAVFQDDTTSGSSEPYNGRVDIMLSALKACLRLGAFSNSLDSKELINLVQGMEDVVHVSANERAPRLHAYSIASAAVIRMLLIMKHRFHLYHMMKATYDGGLCTRSHLEAKPLLSCTRVKSKASHFTYLLISIVF